MHTPPAGRASWSAASKALVRPARSSVPWAERGAGGTGTGGAQRSRLDFVYGGFGNLGLQI
jgi:hypothetical protein